MTNLADALRLQALGCPVEVETEHDWLMVQPWDPGKLCRLLSNHPERQIRLPEWAQPAFEVISGRKWPVPILPPDSASPTSPGQGHSAACEEIVQALAAAGCQPVVRGAFKWRALCPVCMLRGKRDRRLYVERDPQTGRDRLSSFCHCSAADILAVLGLSRPADYALGGRVVLSHVLGVDDAIA